MAKPNYRLVLEAVEGPADDESIEIVATWELSGADGWELNKALLKSILNEAKKRNKRGS